MQRIAVSWLVYRLTGSAFILGIVGFTGALPSFIFAPIAGVWVDRLDKRTILLWTQVVALVQAVALALLVSLNVASWWLVMLLSMVLGLVNAFDVPARQSFVVEMIEHREDLPNAIALNSSLVNIARLFGPSLAGILIALVGEGPCFWVNAGSYLTAIAALLLMRLSPTKPKVRKANVRDELRDGWRYIEGLPPVRSLILLLALVSLMGMPYQVLMPAMAKDVLYGDSRELGFLTGAAGAGALIGAVILASRRKVGNLLEVVAVATLVFGAGLIGFGLSRDFRLSLPLLVFAGLGMMVALAGSNTTIQSLVEDDKRGRVMAFFTMAFMGMMPFGSLFGGTLADRIGAPNTIIIGGVTCIIGGIAFATRLRRYRAIADPIIEARGL